MKRAFKIILLSLGSLIVLLVSFFFVVKKLDRDIIEEGFPISAPYEGKPTLLPTSFIDSARFYVKLPTGEGDTLLAYGDTGGGISMMFPHTVDKIGAADKVKRGLFNVVMPMRYILFSDVVPHTGFPSPAPFTVKNVRRPVSRVDEPFLLIPPLDKELKFILSVMKPDAFLGQNFFMGRSWTIDYPRQQIWVNTPLAASELGKPGVQKIGLKKNSHGQTIFGHPSMYIEVDGELIEVLFDTGATIILSEEGKKALNINRKTIAGSFIAASVFNKWKTKHPDWKVHPKADAGRDVIEVPAVIIGGHTVGPVLFAQRPDEVWSKGMISSMDKVVRGAIGGSGLKYLKVTIDYGNELIRFE